jgi:isoquinoline 1-oxidoreductase beta subunit
MNATTKLTRREFLKLTGIASAGLMVGFNLSACGDDPESSGASPIDPLTTSAALPTLSTPVELDAFISISSDDVVTLISHKAEMGQGVKTSLPMIIAEELCADWSKVHVVQADADEGKYGSQNTGGSYSTVGNYDSLRLAGATVRDMLIKAAAMRWEVKPSACYAENGIVFNQESGEQFRFGELAEVAAEVEPPDVDQIVLKDPADFTIIGTPTSHIDEDEMVTGATIYGLDARVPGLLYATIARCPFLGGRLISFDDSAAKAIEGVVQIVEIDYSDLIEYIEAGFGDIQRQGPVIAVVAENTWAAIKGREALEIIWDEGEYTDFSSEVYWQSLSDTLQERLNELKLEESEENPEITSYLEAAYQGPFVAHVPMEPMNATAHTGGSSAEMWLPAQFPGRIAGFAPGMTVHVTRMGGAFGRRATVDFAFEAMLVSNAVDAPVQVVWTREDDIRYDVFRPGCIYMLRAGLDDQGLPVSMQKVAGGHRPNTETPYSRSISDGYDLGTANSLGIHLNDPPISIGAWRGPGTSDRAFAIECFLDEIAHAGGWDPYELRRKLVTNDEKLAVLDRVVEMAKWGDPLPDGWGRGLACYSYSIAERFTEVAHVAEISVGEDSATKVERMYCAIDPGLAINPTGIISQGNIFSERSR